MNYELGRRIQELRLERKISQEQMAALLQTTRQRYARMESGQVDLSYSTIQKVAAFFQISDKDITNAVQEQKGLVALFREKDAAADVLQSVSMIEEILRVFHAHEKLYHQTRERMKNEDQ